MTTTHHEVLARYRRAVLRETALLAFGALAVAAMVLWATGTPLVAASTFAGLLCVLGLASYAKHRRVTAHLARTVER